MRDLAKHLSVTLRSFARQPGMVLIVVLTLALGIGASTALFAYLAAISWPRIDAPEPERVVWIHWGTPEEPRSASSYLDYLDFLDLQRRQTGIQAFREIAAFSTFGASVGHGQASEFAWGHLVSGGYFSLFGARPQAGRLLQPEDDRAGAEPVVVVSHFFWKKALEGDPGAVGRPLRLNGLTFTLVGVLPERFQGHGHASAIYVPIVQSDRVTSLPRLQDRERRLLSLLGRLAPGVSLEQARKSLALNARALDEAAPLADAKRRLTATFATVHDPADQETDVYVNAARVLMGAALLFLLLTCATVANLLLARATVRQREWGIRASLGASRRRLVGTVLSESLILCLTGAAVGLGLAVLMARRIESYVLTPPPGMGSWSEGNDLIRLDFRVFAFTVAVALLCGLVCGLAPILRVIRGDLVAAVKSDAAGAVGPSGALAPRKLLVVAQVGLSVLLLLGGSLLARTLRNAETVPLGFDPGRLLLASLYVPRNVGSAEQGATEVYRRALEETAGLPGVQSASLSYNVPMGWGRETQVTSLEKPDKPVKTSYNLVAPGYFETLSIPILQGRALDRRDRRDSPPAVVVSRSLADQLWGKENPLGRLLSIPDPPARPGEPGAVFEVVGVTAEARVDTVTKPASPALYLSLEQRAQSRLTRIVRTAAAPASLAPALRRAVQAAHPDLSIVDLVAGDEQMRRSLVEQRMYAEIAGLFGILGLGVSVVGLFGLLSYTVSLRVREFGIRMAIGAQPTNVELLVLRQGMGMVAIGLILGLAGALGLTHLLESLLYGIAANDPATFVGVSLGLMVVTLFACYLPAHRAARLDPLEALRNR
jgi:putative ABC transport system permease protein